MLHRRFLSSTCLAAMLAASLLSAPVLPAVADTAAGKIGSVGAVNTVATAEMQGSAVQALLVGADVFQNQIVRTDAAGLAEIMFIDQSTITVGHASEVVLDNFVYDPNNEVGQLAVRLSEGTLRFIGGKISKKTPVKITAPDAILTIRGGIGIASFPRGQDGLVAFLYGVEITVTGGHNNVTRSIRQPGFGVIVPADGGDPSEPFRLTDAQLTGLRQQLESSNSDQGQANPTKPVKTFGSNDGFKPDQDNGDKTSPETLLNGQSSTPAPGTTNSNIRP